MKSFFYISTLCSLLILLFFLSCDPLVTTFDDVETGNLYKASSLQPTVTQPDKIRVMTWNIRFGAGRLPWFGDSCGDRVILSKSEVSANLQGIADAINLIQPDILLLNEIDIESKRTAYIDEVQWLLDHTYLNYGAFASNWKSQFIPSDGLGRMNMGNAVLSRWKISEAKRIKLSLRGDQDALTTYFYLRRNILKTRIDLPRLDNFYALATHLAAFSTDDTKRKQVGELLDVLKELEEQGSLFIVGGDFNLLPPGSDSTDYCLEDKCPDESYHKKGDDPFHKEGSYFSPEMTWMQPMYDRYQPAVPLPDYLANQLHYFTHSPDPDRFWDRKLDYLFTNRSFIDGSAVTHQNISQFSDHVAVSADWQVPNE